MSERMTDERREELRAHLNNQYLRRSEAEDVSADWDRARAEEARLLELVKKQEEQLRAFTRAAMPLARFVEASNRQPLAQVRAANILYGIHGGDTCWPVGVDVKLSDLEALAAAYAKAMSP